MFIVMPSIKVCYVNRKFLNFGTGLHNLRGTMREYLIGNRKFSHCGITYEIHITL